MNKTTSVFMAAAMAALSSFAAPQKAADITVSGYTGASTLENFPVLVRISPTRISGFSYADCASGGADISFTDVSGAALDFEIDTWDTTGESLIWVKVPSLSGNATTIIFRWNDAAPAAHTPSATWSGFAGVWHLNEENAGAVTISDSTANGVNGTAHSTSSSKADGKVGRARLITTNTEHTPASGVGGITIDSANMAAINAVTPEFTVSMWARTQKTSNRYEYFISRKLADGSPSWAVQLMDSYNPSSIRYYSAGTADSQVASPNPQIKGTLNGVWHKYDFIWKSDGTYAIYIDGKQDSSVGNNLTGNLYNKAVAVNGTYPLCIGGTYPQGSDKGGRGFYGDMDEVRICAGVLSADWVAADYAQVNDASFITYGAAYSLDGILKVSGAPAEIGSPTPVYGLVKNLSVGSPVALSMSATAVTGEGTVTNYLKGWELEAIDLATGVRTPLRSSSDANEVPDSCAYVHASYAEFTWLWDVRDRLGVGTPVVVSKTPNTLVLSADITGIGYTAPSATLKFAYGPSADALLYTNIVSASVTEFGTLQGTLTRLVPSCVYYVQAVLETNDGAHDIAVSEAICVQTEGLFENGEPGLWQTFFTGAKNNWTRDIWALPVGTDWRNYTDANRIRRRELTPIGAYTTLSQKYTSEIWGDQVFWPANGGQWAYAGHIWLDASKSYKFRFKIDDYGYIAVTDSSTGVKTVLLNDGGNAVKTSPAYTPSVTGWHGIEMRFADNTGGAGGYDTSSGYVNSNNLGFSKDGGSTWTLLKDPGDGSLLRAPFSLSGAVITASETVANGALASIALAFPSSDAARALRAAWGPAHGGNDPTDWYATSPVATIAAGATTATWTPPADWGSDTNLVVRFFFDGNPVDWSNSIFWRDYSAPIVTDVAADGTGGDTLAVSGTLASFPGDDCVLTVYTGDSPTTLDNAWAGLAGAVRTATGDFSLTLFESDTTAARYLAPGSTLYVSVQAAANGLVTRTPPVAVRMGAAPFFATSSSSVSRRTVTFTGALADPGAGGSASVRLYVGPSSSAEADLVAVEEPAVVTDTASFSIVHAFDAFETSYKWQLRATATAVGGTASFETRTPVASVATLDTTTYTWTGAGSDYKWSNPDNWTDNQGGDAGGYPRTANATAYFKTDAVVDVDVYATIGTLNLSGAYNLNIVFTSADTVANRLTLNNLTFPKAGSTWTLDHVYIYRNGEFWPAADTTVVLRNKAYLYCSSNEGLRANNARIEIGEDSTNSVNNIYIGLNGTMAISNGYFQVRGHIYLASNSSGGKLLFQGTHPKLYSTATGATFQPETANCKAVLGFEVPEGGYDSAPIAGVAGKTQYFFGTANSKNVTISILDSSPALRGSSPTTTTLVSWSKGFSTDNMTYGAIATADLGSAFAIEDTTNLKVTVVPANRSDRLTILSDCGAPTPAVGLHTGYVSGNTYQLSAGEAVISSDTRRVPVGWKRYAVDAVTGELTFVSEGEGATLSYEHPGEWTAIEWIWRDDCLTSAEGDGHGTATISAEWSDVDSTVTATATPDAGWRFSYWSGDVTDVSILRNPTTFRSDRPRELVANFVPADLVVSNNTYTGAKDGSWNTDANWSLGHVPTAEENAIIPTGKGTVKITNAGRCASLQIVNDAALQLQGSGTVADDQIRLDVRGNAVSTGSNFTLGTSGTSIYDIFLDVGGDLCISNNNRNANLTVYAGDAYGTNTDAKVRASYVGDEAAARFRDYVRGGAQVNVGGKLFLGGKHASNTSILYLHSHYKTGMSPVFRVGALEVGAKGSVNGANNGWHSYNAALYHGLGAAYGSAGASYGGLGGLVDASQTQVRGATYGFAQAPAWPGSAGGAGGTDGGHGGSLFRLHAAGSVRIDGSVSVNGNGWGSNTTRGGGSGGGAWITCDTFDASPSARINAKGGNHSNAGAAAGGGGRIAVAAGCTSEADIASFLATGTCAGYTANDFAETLWPSLAVVSGGVNTADGTHRDWNDGAPGTALYLQNANGKSVLNVAGAPVQVGDADPVYVTHVVDTGDVLCENSAYGYVPGTSRGTRYALDGYVWTNAVTHGEGTAASVIVPVQGETTLVWLWRDLEHNLVATSGGHGAVSAHDDWYADGASVTLTATPAAGASFVRWTGDIDPADAGNATITFAMTSPRRLVAVFDDPSAAPRTLTYAGGDWFDPATWDGVAIPGTNDAVAISSGTLDIPFGATIDVGDLAVSGGTLTLAPTQGAYNHEAASEYATPLTLHVAGDFLLSGSAVLNLGVQNGDVRADIVVDGDLTFAGTSATHAYASVGEADDALRNWRHYKAGGAAFMIGGDLVVTNSAKVLVHNHSHTGVGVVWNVAGNVVIGASAQLSGSQYTADNNAYGYGWAARYGFYDANVGGSYGGNGGGAGSGNYTYGFAYAPYYPGTAGVGNKRDSRGQGGGSVRIAACGDVTIDGKIYVTGGHDENIGQHAGSGGGVWITCASFNAGANALIHARGGIANQHGACYAGGGGRVCVITGSPSEEQIDSLYATGAAEDLLVVAEDMNDALVSPWPTLVNVQGGVNAENAANATYGSHGKPGTAVYLQNAAGKAVVTVTGDQDTTETVPAYGQSTVETGVQNFTAPAFIYFDEGRSRYPCLGYEWEDAAGNTGSGVTTNFTLDVRRDLTVTWHWGTLEHFLDVRDGGFCTVAYEAQGANELGWYDVGTVVRVTCAPEDADTAFDAWLGDVADAVKGNLAINVTVDAPKVVVATLHRDAARARSLVWTGEAGDADWFNKANWDGAGIPGKYDSVLVTNGAFQVKYPSAVEIASLAVSNAATCYWGAQMSVTSFSGDVNKRNGDGTSVSTVYSRAFDPLDARPYSLAVSGDFTAGGSAKLYFGGINQTNRMDIAVGGDLALGGGASNNRTRLQVYAGWQGPWTDVETFVRGGGSVTVGGDFTLDGYAEFSPTANRVSGAPVPVKARTVAIGVNAVVDANVRGYGRSYVNPGTGWKYTAYGPEAPFTRDDRTYGGSYGGLGGGCSTGTYGLEAAPYFPGHAGSQTIWGGGTDKVLSGGGAVRIDAGAIVLNGKITAYGVGHYGAAGGAGGGVWLTCRSFQLGDKGDITADGGRATSYGGSGGGGGGRIAIGLKFTPQQLARLYVRGSVGGMKVTPLAEITAGSELADKFGNPWTGRFSVLGGYGYKGSGSTADVSPAVRAESGTAVLVESPGAGTMLIMR